MKCFVWRDANGRQRFGDDYCDGVCVCDYDYVYVYLNVDCYADVMLP